MQKSRFDARVTAIKAKFRELDKNRDNMLDFAEMKEFLRQATPDAKERDLRWTFLELDKSHRGKLSITEFMTYIHKQDIPLEGVPEQSCSNVNDPADMQSSETPESEPVAEAEEKSSQRRHSIHCSTRLNEPTACEAEGVDWEVVEHAFYHYAGSDKVIQGNEFQRLCRNADLFDDSERFTPGDAEFIFHRCCAKDQRVMKKKGFRDAMVMIADMKAVPAVYLRAAIAKIVPPPIDLPTQQAQESNSNLLRPVCARNQPRPTSAASLGGSIAVALRARSTSSVAKPVRAASAGSLTSSRRSNIGGCAAQERQCAGKVKTRTMRSTCNLRGSACQLEIQKNCSANASKILVALPSQKLGRGGA
jgi:hypothetical protein